MKHKTTILVFLLWAGNIIGQSKYYVYVPARTYHFDRGSYGLGNMANTEGGNLGAILVRQIGHKEVQGGVVKNSFGDFSVIFMVGTGTDWGRFHFGVSGGLATGYHKAYKTVEGLRDQNTTLSRNGILPQFAANFSLKKGFHLFGKFEVSPMIVLSQVFINVGLKINLKQK